jgi:hypothetical protein
MSERGFCNKYPFINTMKAMVGYRNFDIELVFGIRKSKTMSDWETPYNSCNITVLIVKMQP